MRIETLIVRHVSELAPCIPASRQYDEDWNHNRLLKPRQQPQGFQPVASMMRIETFYGTGIYAGTGFNQIPASRQYDEDWNQVRKNLAGHTRQITFQPVASMMRIETVMDELL